MLPAFLLSALQNAAKNYSVKNLKKSAVAVSETYRKTERKGQHLVVSSEDVLSYALTRMPATFEVISSVLKELPSSCSSMIDVGAGTGAGACVAISGEYAKEILCLERELAMLQLGETLLKNAYPQVAWKKFDLSCQKIEQKADIVLSSYVLNELSEENRIFAVEKMWQATNHFLIIIDSGTPSAFEMMKKFRSYLIEQGAFMVAPCPCSAECLNKWCHFEVRVARTKMHKFLKAGQAPFEDEKFTYLIFSKQPERVCRSRVLRHPRIEKGKIGLQLCTKDGIIEKVISKKEEALFKKARKIKAGDALE